MLPETYARRKCYKRVLHVRPVMREGTLDEALTDATVEEWNCIFVDEMLKEGGMFFEVQGAAERPDRRKVMDVVDTWPDCSTGGSLAKFWHWYWSFGVGICAELLDVIGTMTERQLQDACHFHRTILGVWLPSANL